jgi:hypothetical protein
LAEDVMPKTKPRATSSGRRKQERRRIRYGVVGLGWFAQTAILPAFAHAKKNSELAALFSEDPK